MSLTLTPSGGVGDGFSAATSGPAYAAARAALSQAWGRDTLEMAAGGAIPLVGRLLLRWLWPLLLVFAVVICALLGAAAALE